MGEIYGQIAEAAEFLREASKLSPRLAIVLGSGLGAFAKEIQITETFVYRQIPHFPTSTVEGHAGRLLVGRFSNVAVALLAGRVHAYEGYSPHEVAFPVRVLGAWGVKTLVVTNAAGAVNTAFRPGELMLITDHLNLTGIDPLVGPEEPRLGPRFVDMTEAYPKRLRDACEQAAYRQGIRLRSGVYAGVLGPSFETPAEIRMLRTLGADAVGMSTVLEVIAANQMGLGVLGISCISNMAAGILPRKLDHREVMETGHRVRGVFSELLRELIPALARTQRDTRSNGR